jgi:hypothetical protein
MAIDTECPPSDVKERDAAVDNAAQSGDEKGFEETPSLTRTYASTIRVRTDDDCVMADVNPGEEPATCNEPIDDECAAVGTETGEPPGDKPRSWQRVLVSVCFRPWRFCWGPGRVT